MTLRLALVGAFPFPVPQGSQVYAADQARALRRAGAEVTLFSYGRGVGPAPADLPLVRAPAALSPRRVRAGPSALKPAADAALALLVLREAARRGFDALLAHNAEGALVALALRPLSGVPVVYVAHALWRHELPAYGGPRQRALLARAGAALDRELARRADGVIALCEAARRALSAHARGPLALIPPGLDPAPPPDPAAVRRTCARHRLEPGRYALYAGNLDAYQELPDLAAAARALPDTPFVAATHDPRGPALGAVRVVVLGCAEECRLLTHGAGACVLPRAIPGGFPVKLLNYMEAARPIVARAGVADGFEHERSALLLPPGAPPEELAKAVTRILGDADLAARLGRGARALLERRHAWPALAEATLALAAAARPGG